MPFDMKSLTPDVAAATSSTILFGAIGGQTDSAPTPIPISILSTYFMNVLGLTIGTSAITSGTTGRLLYDNAGVLGETANITATGSQLVSSLNGAASTPPITLTGTWFTGGSATTTKPQFLVEPSGTTSTGWSTSGTGLGVNAASGFVGNLVDAQLTGSSKFSINSAGQVTLATSATGGLNFQNSITMSTNGSNSFQFALGGGTFNFARESVSTGAICVDQSMQLANTQAFQWSSTGVNNGTTDTFVSRLGAASVGIGSTNGGSNAALAIGSLRVNTAPTANGSASTTITSGADSSTNLGHRISFNLNGTTYWIPCGSVAF